MDPIKSQRIIENVLNISRRDQLDSYNIAKILDTTVPDNIEFNQEQALTDLDNMAYGKIALGQQQKSLAVSSWEALVSGRGLNSAAKLSIEKIIYPTLRPSVDIVFDTFEDLDANWTDVNAARPKLVPLIKGVGRVNVTGNPYATAVGTAFFVGDNTLITNRHVAELFVSNENGSKKLKFMPGMTAKVDLKQEVAIPDSIILEITAPVLILHEWDVAIFKVSAMPVGVVPLPLCSRKPNKISEKTVVVVGYPSFDPDEDLTAQSIVFRNIYSKKRLMPGKVNGLGEVLSFGAMVNAVKHDCSTLGGNSGSAVIDIELNQVTGLHFISMSHMSNYAVPMWELARIPEVKTAGVIFA